MKSISILLKDNSKIEIPQGSTAFDLAKKLNLTAPHQALGVSINGTTFDLSQILRDKDQVVFFNFEDPQGKEIFWHTSAHLLAQAVLRLWPEAIPTIGPPIENGFYYDFANLHVTDEDLPKIENEMENIVKENFTTSREVLPNKEAALKAFSKNKYKVELIEGFEEEPLSAYRQGEFYDLCRGPHMTNLGKVKALKVLKTSGAYWRGDSKNEMLTRIYGITFPDRKLLKEFLDRLEEAKKRDHKIIGPKLDLFSLHEEAPAMPFIHPKGMIVWNALLDYWRECHLRNNYVEIKTPIMASKVLWETSGHWANYRQNMYTSLVEEREYAIKPMNCPCCMLFFKTHVHSYKEFPYRVAEIGLVHRHEASGAVSGLFRVRCFHQDDAHIFLTLDDVEEEVISILKLIDEIYSTFGLEYHLELSTRPEKNTIGNDSDWEKATHALHNALVASGRHFIVREGEGAFYGPKIDIHIKDAIGRTWQCGTIQLDPNLPERFGLHFDASDGSTKCPLVIHRAIFGAVERFLGILIEHFAGKFPLWLSPRQMVIIPVSDKHLSFAKQVNEKFKQHGFHTSIDDTNNSVSKKVRESQLNQVNYILTVGDREVENKTINVRTRDNVIHGEIEVDNFISAVKKERDERALRSPYSKEG